MADNMYMTYGSYTFPGSVLVDDRSKMKWNKGGQLLSYIRRLTVEGFLQVTVTGDTGNQAGVTLAMSQMRTRLSVPFQDLVLRLPSGAVSATSLLNSGSLTGVRILDVDFPNQSGRMSYVWGKYFTFVAEAEYPFPNTGNALMDFGETLRYSPWGGLPKRVLRGALNTNGQAQITIKQLPYVCTQSGFAVGYQRHPEPLVISPPKYPFLMIGENPIDISYENPEALNVTARKYQGYRSTWTYTMGDVNPLIPAKPTLWT